MKMEFVKELDEYTGTAALYRRGDEHFVVSSTSVLGTPETLAFRADANGDVTDWSEVAGGKYVSREETVAQIDAGDLFDA